jgi:hypothetical protein
MLDKSNFDNPKFKVLLMKSSFVSHSQYQGQQRSKTLFPHHTGSINVLGSHVTSASKLLVSPPAPSCENSRLPSSTSHTREHVVGIMAALDAKGRREYSVLMDCFLALTQLLTVLHERVKLLERHTHCTFVCFTHCRALEIQLDEKRGNCDKFRSALAIHRWKSRRGGKLMPGDLNQTAFQSFADVIE